MELSDRVPGDQHIRHRQSCLLIGATGCLARTPIPLPSLGLSFSFRAHWGRSTLYQRIPTGRYWCLMAILGKSALAGQGSGGPVWPISTQRTIQPSFWQTQWKEMVPVATVRYLFNEVGLIYKSYTGPKVGAFVVLWSEGGRGVMSPSILKRRVAPLPTLPY